MGFFKSSKKETNTGEFNNKNRIPECEKLLEIKDKMESLLNCSHYVAKSEYLDLIPEFEKTIEYFRVLKSSRMLDSFCIQNNLALSDVTYTITKFENLSDLVDQANDKYVELHMKSEKDYLDSILKDVDPNVVLDDDQRKVVLTDEDYSLVIAGAGAGKTTTVAAKVKYLVDKKNIDPKDILVVSFTNKAVGELEDKIKRDLKIDCPITTFHSAGNAIIRKHNPEKLNIVEGNKLYFVLQDYFKESILKNESLVNNLILFFASYFDAPYEGKDLNEFFNKIAKANYSTMKSELDEYKKIIIDTRTKKKVTIQNEFVKSNQEVEIANFLYLNNLEYEYEPIYPFNIAFSKKPYTPDFIIRQGTKVVYLEHFGISEDGKNSMYSTEELDRYKKCVNDKILLHRKHGTKLIYTFSSYNDCKTLLEHLEEKLVDEGFELKPKSNREIMNKLISSEESRYIKKLVSLICRFIQNFKTNGYTEDEFARMYHSTTNVRSKLFLNICEDCYFEYQRYLKENNAVDFEDMINESARILKEVEDMKKKLSFKYIIVDEYQDISRQRFDLTTALSKVTDAKIIAVGDDWQSIYAFSGSDVTLFTKFEEKMGYAKLLKIVRTYRNAQDVIDIAGTFVQKNPTQIKKTLISPKRIEDPVIIYTYDASKKKASDDRKQGVLYQTAKAVETALDQIIEFNRKAGKKEGEDGTILLLGRYGFDGDQLERSGLFEYKVRGSKIKSVKYPRLDITFMTVHLSKGLGYDNVIIINGKNETYGFPSKIEDDPVLSFVIKGDNSIDYAEERRLFYVAMTRTKNRVYFIAPEQNPSEFLLEIKHDYKNVTLKGEWNEEEIEKNTNIKSCPVCGFPMQYRYKNAYGLRLYICTNAPELCGFMTNDIKGGKLPILKCDKCVDGYLIVKLGANDKRFLACTNYKADKTGCNNTLSSETYFNMVKDEFIKPEPIDFSETILKEIEKEDDLNVFWKSDKFEMDDDKELEENFVQEVEDDKTNTKLKDTINRNVKQSSNDNNNIILFPDVSDERKDSFLKEYPDIEIKEVCSTILDALNEVSKRRFQTIDTLINSLRGVKTLEVKKYGFENTFVFGKLSYMSYKDLESIINWLIDNHYMLLTKQAKPKLHITYEGNNFEENISTRKLNKLISYLDEPHK